MGLLSTYVRLLLNFTRWRVYHAFNLSLCSLVFVYLKILLLSTILLCSNIGQAQSLKVAYFAGGCFWCMEESFDKVEGVISVVSGYSGGHLKNPTYADVVYTDSGHVEAVEITYNPKVLSYKKLLK